MVMMRVVLVVREREIQNQLKVSHSFIHSLIKTGRRMKVCWRILIDKKKKKWYFLLLLLASRLLFWYFVQV